MKRNCREIGAEYENRAVIFLKEKGYQIIKQNFRCRQGEIDIIAKDGEYLVFTEVKYRKNAYQGAALEAVTMQKHMHVLRRHIQIISCRLQYAPLLLHCYSF